MAALNAQEFAVYAARQIAAATATAAGHRAGVGGFCGCGRALPCSVAAACDQTRRHFQAKLALLKVTVEPPAVSPARPCRPGGPH